MAVFNLHSAFGALVAFAIGSFATNTLAQTLPPKENFHLFLLIGQSNMAGRGTVEPQDQVAYPRVITLNKTNGWVPAVDPIHFDKSIAGVGLGRTFGIEIAAATSPDVIIGLIPCAVGGTPIDAWTPGAYWDNPPTHPYDDAMVRAQLALQVGTLKGILWHQGESDANSSLAPAYAAKLDALVARVRTELDAPDAPFIVGALGHFTVWNQYQVLIDQTLSNLPTRVPLTAYVSSEGLTDRGDDLHFNSASYREFGHRYAVEFLKLVAPANNPVAPSNLTAMLISSNQINLAWTDISTNETQFRIERKVGGGSYTFLTNRPAIAGAGGSGTYSDTNLSAGITYTYRVRADGTNGNDSAWSSEVSTNTPGGGGDLTNVYEAELLVIAGTSAGDPTENFAEPNASGGTNSLFTANAVGDFITYTVNVPLAGDYNVRVMLNKAANRGRCNLYLDGSATTQGVERDLYNASAYAYQEVDQGNVTFTNAGSHTFRFQVSGKHASASAYKLAFDYLKLISYSPAPLEPPAVTGAVVSGNNFVLTFTAESGGVYEVQRTEELIPPTWIPVVTNLFGNGGMIQITDTNALNRPRTFYRVKRGM